MARLGKLRWRNRLMCDGEIGCFYSSANNGAKRGIYKHIEPYYDRVRMHSALVCMSSAEYERQYA